MKSDELTDEQKLNNIKEAERLISEITLNTTQTDQWIKYLRCSVGYLRDAIKELEKKIK